MEYFLGKKQKDPHAKREAANYAKPIPSREFILDLLESSAGPLTHAKLSVAMKLESEEDLEALRRRLIAMERDGQVLSNRRGAYGRIDKMALIKARISAHKDGFGFAIPADGTDDLYLSQKQMRKVFDRDEVLVRAGETNSRGQRDGSIIEVLVRHTERLVGQLVSEYGNQYVVVDNPKIQQDIFIDKDQSVPAKSGQIVSVEIIQQPERNRRPSGKIVEVLGDHMAPGMEIDVAIRSHDIPHIWPTAVNDLAEKLSSEVLEQDKENRIDLRDLAFVTIDGEDARDFDDAVYCKKSDEGWRLYVAIADVSHYVDVNSAIDIEAQKRGNSVYFPDHVVPMLPEQLSNGLCSLNPHVDRLCMVCEMTIGESGDINSYQFYESIMHSKARLTYTKVGQMLDRKSADGLQLREEYEHVAGDIDELKSLYECLKAKRAKRGAIEFETTETRMVFDEDRKIENIVPVIRNDAHKLIEECMLAANVCAARFLDAHELACLYRIHEPPKEQKLDGLKTFLTEFGLSMPATSNVLPEQYRDILKKVESWPNAHQIQTVMLRSMNQAVYQAKNMGHFGLAYPAYTHFTSPIRRYPDLLVHRAIRSIVRSKRESNKVKRCETAMPMAMEKIYPYSAGDVDNFGEQCSMTERRADDATRDVVSWLKCEYLQDRVGEEFDGVVSAVTGFGLFVELSDVFVEGLVHITALPQDYYQFMAAQHRLVGERSGRSFHLGDSIKVRVVRVSLDDRKIDFELIDDGKSLKLAKKKGAKKKSKKKVTKGSNDNQSIDESEERKPKKRRKPRKRKPKSGDSQASGSSGNNGHSPQGTDEPKKASTSKTVELFKRIARKLKPKKT
ncbi:MAG: ribonuclease R [Flavobacteriales bacterium]|jgi:ribonuclease R